VPQGKRRAFAAILLTTSLVVTVAAAEMFLRFQARGRSAAAARAAAQAQDPDRELSHAERLRPSAHPDVIYELKTDLDGLFLGQRLRTNPYGFRGSELAVAKPAGVRRVVGLGDSHMFGWGVGQDEAYMARLPDRLAAAAGCEWEALNFAVPGYNTVMEVATFEHRALAFEPDLVVLHFVGNDEALPHFLDPNAVPEAPRSFLWDLVRRRFAPPEPEIGDGEGEGEGDEDTEQEDEKARRQRRREERPGQVAARGRYAHLAGERPFATAMDRLGALTRERRIPVLVVALGHSRRPALQAAIARNGFGFLDLSARLHRHLVESGMPDDKATWTRTYRIPGDGHPNALAHRLYAEAIAERLATMAEGYACTATLNPP
jgi:hypothetical protein